MLLGALKNASRTTRGSTALIYRCTVSFKVEADMWARADVEWTDNLDEFRKHYKAGKVDFAGVKSVNLDEHYPITPDNEQSYRYFMNYHLFDKGVNGITQPPAGVRCCFRKRK